MYDFNEYNHILLKSLKSSDFRLWLKLVDIYYKGYHTTLEGKFIFDAIIACAHICAQATNID